jgi:2,4-dienoyl-CoA reductase-like NADH-dependent reductase (Old Yellow Enzyme family)
VADTRSGRNGREERANVRKGDANAPREDAKGLRSGEKDPFAALAGGIRVGAVELRNRVVLPAMTTGFASPEGFLTERCSAYYLARSRGGVGLIIVEPAAVSMAARHVGRSLLLSNDRFVQMHTRLCETLHAEGTKVFVQLMHAGAKTSMHLTGTSLVSPSGQSDLDFQEPALELSAEQIGDIVAEFVSAASRASLAGYDGVELSAAGGFLLHQFLSAGSNRRRDAYGRDLAGRARILADIISAIREAAPALAVSVSIGAAGGQYPLSLDELLEVAELACRAGASCIHVAPGMGMLARTDRVPMISPGQVNPVVEAALKRRVHVPVIGAENVSDIDQAEALVKAGSVDLVALGQPVIADPLLCVKLFEGRRSEVRPCIRCSVCVARPGDFTMTCPANPRVGREQLFWLARRGAGYHVVVIGAGLAGLWTAYVAAELGYTVDLFEPGSILGNLLALRSHIPGQTVSYRIIDHLSRELRTAGVKLHLRRRITVRDMLEQKPDAVFVTRIGTIRDPGVEGLGSVHALDPLTVLGSEPSMGDKVAVLGGGLMGAELAYYLAKRGKQVSLVEARSRVASDTRPELRQHVIAALREMDCPVYVGVQDLRVNAYGEVTAQHKDHTLRMPVETVILAGNYEPCDTSYNELEGKVPEMHLIGDAYETAELTRLVCQATGLMVDMADRLQAKRDKEARHP